MILAMKDAHAAVAARKQDAKKAAQVMSRSERRAQAEADTRPRVTLSFYRYVQIADPQAFKTRLQTVWGDLGCLGRIYVAHEGINAQMNVPKEQWDAFDAWVKSQPELRGVPYKIAVEEGEGPSFIKLTIKVKDKIVADGLDDDTFDVLDLGIVVHNMTH